MSGSRDFALIILRQNPGRRFKKREIAEEIARLYPDWFEDKRARSNPRVQRNLEQQVGAELGGRVNHAWFAEQGVHITDEKPQRMYFDPSGTSPVTPQPPQPPGPGVLSEEKLYDPLCRYLRREQNVYANRIDERKGSNAKGKGGNHWLFPDIAGFRPISKGWDNKQREIMKLVGGSQIEFWSIEVKKELTTRNLRESYFQAVSNSSWANLGYLAAPFDVGQMRNEMFEELQMLSDLHGIGLMRLEMSGEGDNLQGEIIFPARRKEHADWTSLNRLTQENSGLMDLVENVEIYLKAGRLPKG